MTTMAPALINGLRGMPCSRSSWTIELKGEPEGSRPTRCHSVSPRRPSAKVSVKTLETLWMENGTLQSPTAAVSPLQVTIASPNWRGSTRARAGM